MSSWLIACVNVLLYLCFCSVFLCLWSLTLGVLLSLWTLLTLRGDFGFDFATDLGADLSMDLLWLFRLLSFCFNNCVNSISWSTSSCSWLILGTLGLKLVIVSGVRAILFSFSLLSLSCITLLEGWHSWMGVVESSGEMFCEFCCNSWVKVNALVYRSEQEFVLGRVGEL